MTEEPEIVTLSFSVPDPVALYEAACAAYGEPEGRNWLAPAGKIDLQRCLLEILCASQFTTIGLWEPA